LSDMAAMALNGFTSCLKKINAECGCANNQASCGHAQPQGSK
jgi:hypothetical protein